VGYRPNIIPPLRGWFPQQFSPFRLQRKKMDFAFRCIWQRNAKPKTRSRVYAPLKRLLRNSAVPEGLGEILPLDPSSHARAYGALFSDGLFHRCNNELSFVTASEAPHYP